MKRLSKRLSKPSREKREVRIERRAYAIDQLRQALVEQHQVIVLVMKALQSIDARVQKLEPVVIEPVIEPSVVVEE